MLFRLTESDDIENLSLSSILAHLTPALGTSNSSVNSVSGEGLTLLPPLVTAWQTALCVYGTRGWGSLPGCRLWLKIWSAQTLQIEDKKRPLVVWGKKPRPQADNPHWSWRGSWGLSLLSCPLRQSVLGAAEGLQSPALGTRVVATKGVQDTLYKKLIRRLLKAFLY